MATALNEADLEPSESTPSKPISDQFAEVRFLGIRRSRRAEKIVFSLLTFMGKWVYFYRAVDSTGATIDFLLSAKRDEATAERFLEGQEAGRNPGLIKGQQAAEPKRWAGRTLRRRG